MVGFWRQMTITAVIYQYCQKMMDLTPKYEWCNERLRTSFNISKPTFYYTEKVKHKLETTSNHYKEASNTIILQKMLKKKHHYHQYHHHHHHRSRHYHQYYHHHHILMPPPLIPMLLEVLLYEENTYS